MQGSSWRKEEGLVKGERGKEEGLVKGERGSSWSKETSMHPGKRRVRQVKGDKHASRSKENLGNATSWSSAADSWKVMASGGS
jgi:hypothetical protein